MLITIEGADGSGKSTFIQNFAKVLSELEVPHTLTREPGGTEVGEAIRSIILSNNLTTSTDMVLMFASRFENIEQRILPALKRQEIVLSDRFIDSSYIYQVSLSNGSEELFKSLEKEALEMLPYEHMSIFIDVPVEVSLERCKSRNEGTDKFELLSTHTRKVNGLYKDRMNSVSHKVVTYDGTLSIDDQIAWIKAFLTTYSCFKRT